MRSPLSVSCFLAPSTLRTIVAARYGRLLLAPFGADMSELVRMRGERRAGNPAGARDHVVHVEVGHRTTTLRNKQVRICWVLALRNAERAVSFLLEIRTGSVRRLPKSWRRL